MINLAGEHIHFIGIGGISMRGLAEILYDRGCKVSGSDRSASEATERMEKMGIEIHIGHDASNVGSAELVVYTSAIPADNPELVYAREHGIPLMKRSELLGEIMNGYQTPIVVSGAHGKTTTTSMISTIFYFCGQDPTVHNGGVMPLFDDATYVGGTKYFIAEGCEYKENFLDLRPKVAVLLNIDADHLDYYRDIDHITSSFKKYASLVPEDGLLIVNGDDPRCVEVAQSTGRKYLTFGFSEGCDYTARALDQDQGCYRFELKGPDGLKLETRCPVQGRHHVYNASAALACAHSMGLNMEDACKSLGNYTGAERRMQKTGEADGCPIYQDYAHHPSEVKAVLDTARLMSAGRVIAAFQPHTFTRTKALFDRFVYAFDQCDTLILLDIYAAREKDKGEVSSAMLAEAIAAAGIVKDVRYASSFEEAAQMIKDIRRTGDLIITLGAGSIEKLNGLLV